VASSIADHSTLRLLAELRRDSLLAGATLLLAAAVLTPLLLSPLVPFQDLPNHTALAALLVHMLCGGEVSSHHFMVQPHPSPYWVGYLLIGLGTLLGSALWGAKLFVAAALLAVPLGCMRMMLALGRSPRMGLWAFALAWDYNMSWGFVAFSLATGLSFFLIAWVLELQDTRSLSWKRLTRAAVLSLLVGLTHAQVTLITTLLIGALALAELPRWRRLGRLTVLSVLVGSAVLPWVVLGPPGTSGSAPDRVADWPNIPHRLNHLYHHTLDTVAGDGPENLLGIAFVILLVYPLLLLARDSSQGIAWRRGLALYGAAWSLYLLLPATLHWPFFQLFIYERHATLVLLTGMMVPAGQLVRRRSSWLAPGLLAACLAIGCNLWLTRGFARDSMLLATIIASVERERRVLPLIFTTTVPESKRTPLNQVSAYLVAEKGGYSPYLFNTPNLPVRYRDHHALPSPDWARPGDFSMAKHAPHYDYILVQGKTHDPIKVGPHPTDLGQIEVALVKEAGIWRLYSVKKI
jgi:hypothetical protein